MISENNVDLPLYTISKGIKNLKEGLHPELLAYWYKRIEDKSIDSVPTNLKDKIQFRQDRVLWMKFKMDVSRRAVPYVMRVIEEYIPLMPYSTGLYFRKVQQILADQVTMELR
jgi:hypothetical protein